jgi:D-glycero-alpha-D-manno-heptose-7-phosphate kinase
MIVRSRAPLRLGFGGGGTDLSPYCDVYGGYVLNATINKYAYCTVESSENGKIEFCASERGEKFKCDSAPSITVDGDLQLHKAVYNRIISNFNNGNPLNVKITTHSDAPAGSGLGSSSTMVIALIQAMLEYLNRQVQDYDLAHLAYSIERIDMGMSGGKQDQYAATFGGMNFIEFYADDRVVVNPLRIKEWVVNELESSLLLYYTGVSREYAKIIMEQVEKTKSGDKTNIDAMHRLKEEAVLMKEAVLRRDLDAFADALGRSWVAKKQSASVISNPLIEKSYNTAVSNGARCGKISGAGGGGFMMFIVDPTKKPVVKTELEKLGGICMDVQLTSKGVESWIVGGNGQRKYFN